MTTAQLVRKLLELGATPELVEVVLEAVEAARKEGTEPQRRRPSRAKRPEIVVSREAVPHER